MSLVFCGIFGVLWRAAGCCSRHICLLLKAHLSASLYADNFSKTENSYGEMDAHIERIIFQNGKIKDI
jgi:hypothetical protein